MNKIIDIEIDGKNIKVGEGETILKGCASAGFEIPTLCYAENLTPVNACRLCMVELEGSRTLVPACSRKVEPEMKIKTNTTRVENSRRLVLQLLASSTDLSRSNGAFKKWLEHYRIKSDYFGIPNKDKVKVTKKTASPGHHESSEGNTAAVKMPVKIQDELYIRDYERCVLCYKCVEACGEDAQNTFAISVAGRGFDAHISTEYDNPLPESACVYCGNCIGVCPTGALMFKAEYDLRENDTWDESKQKTTSTVCSYCGVGCNLELHVQDNKVFKVTSPEDHSVTNGHLCVKGRFGFQFIQNLKEK